ncbi:MAG: hypothetical protein VB047_08140 [Anaerotignum propionicum]|uniref:hypothetical protein n=1 Tax=Anaerotignum propionicum TaxID=28446 RepID=UPI002B1FBDC2|nr:hypothetical protein [Anaerotignum propionicum]MEA5057514.1 hypothetical protein [Anaerotignum propionicum]
MDVLKKYFLCNIRPATVKTVLNYYILYMPLYYWKNKSLTAKAKTILTTCRAGGFIKLKRTIKEASVKTDTS